MPCFRPHLTAFAALLIFLAGISPAYTAEDAPAGSASDEYFVGVCAPVIPRGVALIASHQIADFITDGMNIAVYSFPSGDNKKVLRWRYVQEKGWSRPAQSPIDSPPVETVRMLDEAQVLDGSLHLFIVRQSGSKFPGSYEARSEKMVAYQKIIWSAAIKEGEHDVPFATALTALLAFSWDTLTSVTVLEYDEQATEGEIIVTPSDWSDRRILNKAAVRPWSVTLDAAGKFDAGLTRWRRTFWRIPVADLAEGGSEDVRRALEILKWELTVAPDRPIATLRRLDAPDKIVDCIPVVNGEAIVPVRLAFQLMYDGVFIADPQLGSGGKPMVQVPVFQTADGVYVYYTWGHRLAEDESGQQVAIPTEDYFVTEIYMP